MLKAEVFKVLVLIESVYPRFTLKSKSVEDWFNQSKDIDFEGVMKKLQSHMRNSPYPPALDEIIVYNHINEDLLDGQYHYNETAAFKWLKDYIVKL